MTAVRRRSKKHRGTALTKARKGLVDGHAQEASQNTHQRFSSKISGAAARAGRAAFRGRLLFTLPMW
ncbi:hypothetical protein GB937_010381 [Aspergillus fischeri]|nr:hypothetical protein GB937_010381 [Aspergillus fischeri]